MARINPSDEYNYYSDKPGAGSQGFVPPRNTDLVPSRTMPIVPGASKEIGSAAKLDFGSDPTKTSAADLSSREAELAAEKESLNTAKTAMGYLGPLQAGMGAGSNVTPTTSVEGAVLQAGGAGLTGAASGAMTGAMIGAMGGPIGAAGGAAIGGLVGLAAGGLNAYLGLTAAREQKRAQERQNREIRRLNALSRKDAARQDSENRKMRAVQARWDTFNYAQNRLFEVAKTDEDLKQIFITQGR